jgi:hypothetical protein
LSLREKILIFSWQSSAITFVVAFVVPSFVFFCRHQPTKLGWQFKVVRYFEKIKLSTDKIIGSFTSLKDKILKE